jgi:23S rRNA pseudoU1915 N3-methylase RlmH
VCGCQGDATKVLANKLIEIGKAQTGKAEKNESEVVNEAIQELLKNFRVVAPKVEPKQEKVEQKPTNCDFNCQECKESHAEAMRKRINEDPILSLLDIVRMAAATGKR